MLDKAAAAAHDALLARDNTLFIRASRAGAAFPQERLGS